MRIIFVRHGEPDYALDCLTQLGQRQAQAAAVRLRGEGIEAIFSSPMGRALQTAQAASEALGIFPVRVLPGMREIQWGSTDGSKLYAGGHPWDIADKMARDGWDLADPGWPDHPLFRTNLATEEAQRVALETDRWLASLGYDRAGAYYRCREAHDREITVALFSHGGSSAAVMARLFGLPFPYMCAALHLPFTGITIARLDRMQSGVCLPRLELVGDGRHIRGL